MLKVSYDIKPLPPNIKRIRLNVIDSFINQEIIELENLKNKVVFNSHYKAKKRLQKLYEKSLKKLEDEIENKRVFMIKLRGILSCRRPESIEFIRRLNEENKDLRFDLVAATL